MRSLKERAGCHIGNLGTCLLLMSILGGCGGGPDGSDAATSVDSTLGRPEVDRSGSLPEWTGRGAEPFWNVKIKGLETEFRQPDAGYVWTADGVSVDSLPDGRVVAKFTKNDAPYLIVTRTDGLCLDNATGAPLPYALEVHSGEQVLHGCGGKTEEYLAGESWVVEDVNNKGVVDGGEPRISFGPDGKVILNSICREIDGRFSVKGPELIIEFESIDDQGCKVPALKNQEDQILDATSFPLSMTAEDGEGLVLQSGRNHRLLLQR